MSSNFEGDFETEKLCLKKETVFILYKDIFFYRRCSK